MSAESVPDAEQTRQELERLAQEQNKALEMAIYVGMNHAEQKRYDERHERIVTLIRRLRNLEAAS
jgi:hypothetical protein